MNLKVTFVTINRVFFITNGLSADATWKSYYHKRKYQYLCWPFGRQLASYFQVTGLRVVTHMGCALYIEALPFLN